MAVVIGGQDEAVQPLQVLSAFHTEPEDEVQQGPQQQQVDQQAKRKHSAVPIMSGSSGCSGTPRVPRRDTT